MNVSFITTLKAVAAARSFTAAADVLGCSPSAVSLQVKQMEEYFGKALFERSTRSVTSTAFAGEVLSAIGDVPDRIQALRTRPVFKVQGRVRLGVITSVQSDVLPVALHRLRQVHPALEALVPPLNDSEEILAQLKSGRLEVAIVAKPEAGVSRSLVWKEVQRQPYVMLAPRDAPAKDAKQLLLSHPWIAYDHSIASGKLAARLVRALAPQARHSLELRSIDAIVSMVGEGLGVSVMPRPRQALLAAYPVREVHLGRQAPFRRIFIVWRASDAESRNVQSVVDVFSRAFSQSAAQEAGG